VTEVQQGPEAMNPAASQSTSAEWFRIARRFAPYRWRLCWAAVLVVTSVTLSMIAPLLLQRVINDALPSHDTRLLIALCSAMIVSGVLSSGIYVALNYVTNSIGQHVVDQLRIEVYSRVQRLPLEFFSAEPNSEIQARMTSDIGGISDILTYAAQGALAGIVSLLAAGLVMFILSWPLALTSLFLACALNLLNNRFSARRRTLATERQDRIGEMLGLVGEQLSMSGIILGRTLLRANRQRSSFVNVSGQIADLTRRQRLIGGTARAVIGVTLACLPPTVYILSGTLVPGLSLGTVVVLATMQTRLSGPIQELLSLSGSMQGSMAMFQRIFAYLDMRPAVPEDTGLIVESKSRDRTPIHARDISYSYPAATRVALTDINIDISPGSTTLIVGETGSGKSTLALILAGLLAPACGTIEVDGTPRSTFELWPYVTLVPQETAIFNTTIRDNLLFARPDATEPELLDAIMAAQLGKLISRLPDGIETMVGDNGHQLSGGERQRLAIARALLSRSPILIADEATSALDAATAAAVHQSLRAHYHHGALVLIAHRVPDLEDSDTIVVLQDGRIVERRSGAEMMRNNTTASLISGPRRDRHQTLESSNGN